MRHGHERLESNDEYLVGCRSLCLRLRAYEALDEALDIEELNRYV